MFRARQSFVKARYASVFLLALCAVILSAVPTFAQERSFGPDTYVIDNTPPIDPSSQGSSSTFTGSAGPGLIITGNFTANFNANFGANAAAAQAAWNAAAQVLMNNFSDPIHVNITVDAVAGTGVFGQSSTFLNSLSYATMRTDLVNDSKTPDDALNLSAGGSFVVADPVAAGHTWWVSRAQAKAIGLIADDLSNDGTTTFGAGNSFSFSGTPSGGLYDFQGVCAHEISEVMGRLGLSGATIGSNTNSYSLIDNESYTAPGTKGLTPGAGNNFSIDAGTTLLKVWNNSTLNGLDTRDWAPSGAGQGGDGSPDSYNQFSSPGVVNPVTTVDLRNMDVIGYDRVVPEPSTFVLLAATAIGFGGYRIRKRRATKTSVHRA